MLTPDTHASDPGVRQKRNRRGPTGLDRQPPPAPGRRRPGPRASGGSPLCRGRLPSDLGRPRYERLDKLADSLADARADIDTISADASDPQAYWHHVTSRITCALPGAELTVCAGPCFPVAHSRRRWSRTAGDRLRADISEPSKESLSGKRTYRPSSRSSCNARISAQPYARSIRWIEDAQSGPTRLQNASP